MTENVNIILPSSYQLLLQHGERTLDNGIPIKREHGEPSTSLEDGSDLNVCSESSASARGARVTKESCCVDATGKLTCIVSNIHENATMLDSTAAKSALIPFSISYSNQESFLRAKLQAV